MPMQVPGPEQLRVLLDGIVQVVPELEFRRTVEEAAAGDRPPLRAKLGVDPTRPDLHLGHAVQLRKLRQFQRLGHTAVLIIGALPHRWATRRDAPSSAEQHPLSVMELLYPVLQGQDSVAVRSDVELGGTDQTFNMLVGRHLQSAAGQRPQAVMTLPLLTGLDGEQKMSKSFDNYVAFDDPPEVMYRKLAGVPEALLEEYLRLTTDLHPDETDRLVAALHAGEMSPGEMADRLAREVVALYYDPPTAERIDQLPESTRR